ncbi:MAG: hypothetical protein ACFFDM_04570 [Candidatus Thorarchaeota archaeon]
MIDDDFESVFREMMEQFMKAFGSFPEGNGIFRSWSGSFITEPFDSEIEPRKNEPNVEKIELGDSVIFLIQGHFDFDPTVKVDGKKITVKTGSEYEDVVLETDFLVDIKRSKMSYRNGVIEITAMKTESLSESEGYLKIE